jgi:acyl carrier protein
VEDTINEFISQRLVTNPELLPLSNDASLMDSNILDSVAFLDLVMFLEEQFGISVADSELTRDNFETINAITAYVKTKQGAQVGS